LKIEKMEGGDEGGIDRVVDSKDLQQRSKALDKLTDRVEDRQLDSTRVQEAMASIASSAEADANAMRLRYPILFDCNCRLNILIIRAFNSRWSY
jgi:phage gp36-like protein